jgi:ATP adenylyltransferase
MTVLLFEPGSLFPLVEQTTKKALRSGALKSIITRTSFIKDHGVPFLVRISQNLAHKDASDKADRKAAVQGKPRNPFLPYEESMFVCDVLSSHLILLNKFNVVDHHLLLVTREFVDQREVLDRSDFLAMWAVLSEIDGLFFYNGGPAAGASQAHKHLQLVPLPMVREWPRLPLTDAALHTLAHGENRIAQFDFDHLIYPLDGQLVRNPLRGADITISLYQQMVQELGLDIAGGDAYNLLATRDWMMIVPRRAEAFEGIQINSLGFAGSLFVRSKEQMDLLKQVGALEVLRQVGRPIHTIRRAQVTETAFLSELAMRSKAHWGYDTAFMEACREELTLTPESLAEKPTFVIETRGQMAGYYALAHETDTRVELDALFVDPPHIGTGLGRRLLSHAKVEARHLGYEVMFLAADPDALPFYQAMGGVKVGETPSQSIVGRSLPLVEIAL